MGNGAESKRQSSFATKKPDEGEVRFDVKDTDFLLKLMLDSNFPGRDIEQAYITMSKIATIHRQGINGKK